MKNKITLLLYSTIFAVLFSLCTLKSYASGPTDEIEEYNMTIDVLDDGTVSIDYHIDWLVLDSDELGPVEWLQIGIPNNHYISMTALSDNISSIDYSSDSYGYYARVDFYEKYYEGEHVVFDYNVVMDYLYEVDKFTEGETVYYFAPGWFDGIETKSMTIRWNAENAISWTPNCLNKEGYLTWEQSLGSGDTLEVSVTYPTDAYSFDTTKNDPSEYENYYDDYSNDYYGEYDSYDSDNIFDKNPLMMVLGVIVSLIGGVFALLISCWPILLIVFIVYKAGKGFKPAAPTTRKEIKRTLIKYYPTCPGCGAARPEGKEKCDYCGRSFIESEEIIEEKDIPNPTQYSTEGTYKYHDNSAIRVHVVNIPVVTSRPSSSSSHRSSCAHSSCAHSSCACAHSCACACACACAGGGRAGCSKKDFYNTGLKLKQLELKKKYRK